MAAKTQASNLLLPIFLTPWT